MRVNACIRSYMGCLAYIWGFECPPHYKTFLKVRIYFPPSEYSQLIYVARLLEALLSERKPTCHDNENCCDFPFYFVYLLGQFPISQSSERASSAFSFVWFLDRFRSVQRESDRVLLNNVAWSLRLDNITLAPVH